MKPCIRCNQVKPLTDFYAHSRMGDGHLNKCKDCCRTYARTRHYRMMKRPDWAEAERARGREKAGRWPVSTPNEIKAAETAAYRALRRIPEGMERHHWSYKREHWLDVILLQIGAHRSLHRHMEYDADSRQFRTPRGHLLDTKRKHVRWLLAVLNVRYKYQEAAA